ncbi:MAG: hypothetical protein JWM72_3196 [Actinomycetia bacterium]|nr:hypothetical protein [Actinomycetes bacterium]
MTLDRARRDRAPHDEAGFTLAELIVSIAIEAIIFGALATAFVVLLHGGTSINENLARSSDARFAANYLISDARNSSGPEISLINTTLCPDPTPPVAGTPVAVALFGWNNRSSTGVVTANLSNYVLVNSALLRRHCEGGVLVGDQVLATNIGSVTVACAPNLDCSGDPTSITVTITETAETVVHPGAPVIPPYSYTLTAAFRQRQSDGRALPASTRHPLILLGGGCTAGGSTGILMTGAAFMRVYGEAYINTMDSGACNAMNLQNSGVFRAGSTSILTGGSCVDSGTSVCPPATAYSPALTDPFAGLPVPPTTGMASQAGCPSGKAQPGVYAANLTFGSSNCELQTGIYVLRAGFNLGNGAQVTTAPGGVLIYMTGGAFNVGGGAALTLTALATGPYADVALWQAAADTSPITFSNGGALRFNGAIYGPKAQLVITGNAQTPYATSIVVQTIWLSNSGGITIGDASPTPLSTNASPPTGAWTVNRAFPTTTMVPAGGDGNYTVSMTGLPAGMAFNPTTLVLSGTPTTVGTTSATIKVKDDLGDDPIAVAYPITINTAPSITTASPLADAEVTDSYLAGISTSAGTTPFIWSQSDLPAGLAMSMTTGAITGTPTASGAFTVVVTLTDASGAAVSKSLALAITPAPSITTGSLPGGQKSLAYSTTLAGSGGTTPYSWSAPGLPSGLTLNATSGVISGTPNGAAGTTSFTVTLTDGVGGTMSKNLSILIADQPSVVSVALTNGSGTAGTIDTGDKVTIVYSSQMSVAGFCSTWTNNAADQALIANNDVTVSISNSTTDVLTVTSAACPSFTIGSINLASAAYVSVAATFKGTGTGVSKINWTTATRTLVITLGTKATGTVANVTTLVSPVYTAAGSIKDPSGAIVGNSTFTASPAAQRF